MSTYIPLISFQLKESEICVVEKLDGEAPLIADPPPLKLHQ